MGTLALMAQMSAWGIGQWAICLVVVLGIIALVGLAIKYLEINVHPIIWKALGVILVVVVIVFAIKFLMTL